MPQPSQAFEFFSPTPAALQTEPIVRAGEMTAAAYQGIGQAIGSALVERGQRERQDQLSKETGDLLGEITNPKNREKFIFDPVGYDSELRTERLLGNATIEGTGQMAARELLIQRLSKENPGLQPHEIAMKADAQMMPVVTEYLKPEKEAELQVKAMRLAGSYVKLGRDPREALELIERATPDLERSREKAEEKALQLYRERQTPTELEKFALEGELRRQVQAQQQAGEMEQIKGRGEVQSDLVRLEAELDEFAASTGEQRERRGIRLRAGLEEASRKLGDEREFKNRQKLTELGARLEKEGAIDVARVRGEEDRKTDAAKLTAAIEGAAALDLTPGQRQSEALLDERIESLLTSGTALEYVPVSAISGTISNAELEQRLGVSKKRGGSVFNIETELAGAKVRIGQDGNLEFQIDEGAGVTEEQLRKVFRNDRATLMRVGLSQAGVEYDNANAIEDFLKIDMARGGKHSQHLRAVLRLIARQQPTERETGTGRGSTGSGTRPRR